MKKITINELPPNDSLCYSHLQPLVDFLLDGGNKSLHPYLWGNDRTGYFCHLQDDIDFEGIRKNFDLPASIKINEKEQTIDCMNTYSLIKYIAPGK